MWQSMNPVLALVFAFIAAANPSPPLGDAADPVRIARARDAMRPLGREGRLGPWRLITDVAGGELTGLDDVAAHLPGAYSARYGLSPGSDRGQVVVIYSSDTRYRRFVDSDGSHSLAARGHAGDGMAAFALAIKPPDRRVLLVHELTHLLSRRALGAPPPWLDEGLALDLAWCAVDAEGRLQPDTFGDRENADAWIQTARAGRLPPLAALLSPSSRLFSDPGSRHDATTASGMLVRWCLEDPQRAANFRAFLRSAAKGGSADAPALASALGVTASALEQDFFAWSRLPH
jgi:hypothetical protein